VANYLLEHNPERKWKWGKIGYAKMYYFKIIHVRWPLVHQV
jgi:hypothetical protein